MDTLRLIAGGLLLLLGRRLFWLFVGLTGFAAGLLLAPYLFPNGPDWLTLLIALGLGIVGALLAVFLQRLAIAVAGFFAGALVGSTLTSALAGEANAAVWVGMIVGGILGAILLSTVFDWRLIGLSSFVGATMVVDALHLTAGAALTATIVLFIVGIAFQMFTGKSREGA